MTKKLYISRWLIFLCGCAFLYLLYAFYTGGLFDEVIDIFLK